MSERRGEAPPDSDLSSGQARRVDSVRDRPPVGGRGPQEPLGDRGADGGPRRYLSLFSGIGGIDIAVEAFFGYEPAAFVEWDASCQQVLAKHWPGVPIFGDIREFRADHLAGPIDLICGGFPCQDLSAAGKRTGFKGDRSSLFYELARVVSEVGPRFVLLENVRGLLTAVGSYSGERGAAMAEVTGTLADLGFSRIDWVMLGASDVGAPHRRHRIFLLAQRPDAHGIGRRLGRQELLPPRNRRESQSGAGGLGEDTSDSISEGLQGLARDGVGGDEPGRDAPRPHRPTRKAGGFSWGAYEPAIRRWERVMGPAPRPVDEKNRLSPEFVAWMMALPTDWNEAETRTNRLKQLGNAVVWLQAYRALELLTGHAATGS